MPELAAHPAWRSMPAVRNRRVYVADGNAYYNRPRPRVVESVEILAEMLHPNTCRGMATPGSTSESEPSFFRSQLAAGRSDQPTFFSITPHLPLRRPTPLISPFPLFPSSCPRKRESNMDTCLRWYEEKKQAKDPLAM